MMQKINQLERGVKSVRINNITVPLPEYKPLSSGNTLHFFRTKGIDAVKLEVVFDAGRLHEQKKMVAQACGALMVEGTFNRSSAEISETVDNLGGHLNTLVTTDAISIKLIASKKNFEELLPLVGEILTQPSFPEEELRSYIERQSQKMAIQLSKNDVVAYRQLTENMFGTENPYGYNSSIVFLKELTSGDLLKHHRDHCTVSNAQIFVSGDIEDEHLARIENLIINLSRKNSFQPDYQRSTKECVKEKIKGRERQTSLKYGLPLFDRRHPDYAGWYILNTILGGYFGSRLMKNIREEKGFTYNIYSMLDMYKYDGALIISCDLDHRNVQQTELEIEKEFARLKKEPIPEEELEMVKNYLLGNFMSTINGPFKAINPHKVAQIMNLGENFFCNVLNKIQTIEQSEILELSSKYLHLNNFWKVIVGKG